MVKFLQRWRGSGGNVHLLTSSLFSKLTVNTFVDSLRKNFLLQHINQPTRARGRDNPHVLDLVITDEYCIDNLTFESPLGKSDHSVLIFDCNFTSGRQTYTNRNRLNYAKGDYESLRGSLELPWNDILSPHLEMYCIMKSICLFRKSKVLQHGKRVHGPVL